MSYDPKAPRPSRKGIPLKPWTTEEEATVRRLWPNAAPETVKAALPGRPWRGISQHARVLGVSRTWHPLAWSDEHKALLLEHYPTKGGRYVAKLVGRTVSQVGHYAASEGVARSWPAVAPKRSRAGRPRSEKQKAQTKTRRVKRERAARKEAVKAKKLVQAAPPKPAVVVPEPVKRSPATPNLNAQKVASKAAAAPKPSQYVKAEQIKSLPANHPARLAWTVAAYRGPAAATAAFHEAMKQAA